MSILWCGGEDLDFPTGPQYISTNSSYRRSDYCRCALDTNVNPAGLVYRSKTFPGGAVTSFWLSVQFWHTGTATSPGRKIGLGKASSINKGFFVGIDTASNLKLAIYKFDGSTETKIATTADVVLESNSLTKIDVHVTSYGASAAVAVYVNGESSPCLEYSGNISVSGVTDLDCCMMFSTWNTAVLVSEIIIADEDTRTFSLASLYPESAGSLNEWENEYTEIDEASLNDADTIYTDTAELEFNCNLAALPSGNFSVVAVKVSARACKTADATAGALAIGVLTLGELSVGDNETMTTAWDNYENLMQENPISSEVWTPTEMNQLQFAAVSKS